MKLKRNDPCPTCGRFDNRGVSIDAVIIKDTKILLIKRGSQPYKGFWGTPGGYVDWDESAEETVKREVKEETGLEVIKTSLIGVYSNPTRHPKQTINIVYIAYVASGEAKASDDATEVKWFPISELPNELAFDHKQNIADAIALTSTQS